jgi:hypothetical protein
MLQESHDGGLMAVLLKGGMMIAEESVNGIGEVVGRRRR